jgi:phosphinothricin acetyltransferase
MKIKIRLATPLDAREICDIYNPYVKYTAVTFEESPVSEDEMASRIESKLKTHAWLVAEDESNKAILGYAYAGTWRERQAYRHTAEVTVYVKEGSHGNGIGKALYQELLSLMKEKHYNVLVAGIALPNEKSIGVHEALGFKKVAHFSNVGYKFKKWMDIGFWECQLDTGKKE